MEREIQEVRMGNQALVARQGYIIRIDDFKMCAEEVNAITQDLTKELWLGSGAFIVYKESLDA